MSVPFPFKKKLLPLLLILLLAVPALAGCEKRPVNTGASGEKIVLNEVAHSIFYAPMYVAIEEGYFQEAGIDLELVTGFGAVIIIQNQKQHRYRPLSWEIL